MNYTMPLNTWVHVVFTYSNGVVTGYINGSSVTFSTNTFLSGGSISLQAYGLNIGTDPSTTNSIKGYLNDVRLYNRALASGDVAALYAATPH
jgi:hypothetical protein